MATGALCHKANCEVAKTGKCALGNDPLESCPEYDVDEVGLDHGEEDEDFTESGQSIKPDRRIRHSNLLDRRELWPVRKSLSTTTVSLVGDVRAGKTTLIAALYASFCKGPFAGYSFKSSRTLTAFARRHHRALDQSKRTLPTMSRTSRQDGVGFFHLNVVGPAGGRHLMIADRSGEDFQDARRNTDLITNLWELEIADRICFILDAGKVADRETRAGYKREFKQQIWALLNNNAVPSDAVLEIVSTKLDKLAPRGETAPELDELNEFENATLAEFLPTGRRIETRRICALPRSNFAVGVLGLEELFQAWLLEKSVEDNRLLPAADPARWIDRMLPNFAEGASGG